MIALDRERLSVRSSRRVVSPVESWQNLHFFTNCFFLGCPAFLSFLSLASPTSSCTEHEKTSLLQFHAGLLRGSGLTASWRNNTNCCTWKGITCSSPNETVTGVSLASQGLEGSISPFLGNLTSLLHLNLSHNSLSGSLPVELVSSSSITILDVSFNQLNGTLHQLPSSTPARPLQVLNISSNLFAGQFPSTTWKAMENLIALNASNNSFTGQIQTHFCNSSPSFAVLDLCLNKFSGNIPRQLGDCSKMRELRAGYNHLSGEVPDELFNATSLECLSFRNNDLSGVLDGVHITKLRNLVTLDLGGNNFNGEIPDSIGQLKKLEEFHLDNNKLSGELPSALSNCTNLVAIDLKKNNFSGQLSKVNFSNLSNLKTLDVYLNHFTGTVPESIYSCSNLTALRVSTNKLEGQLSPRMSDLKKLRFLSLSTNSFSNIANALHILKSCRNLTTLLIGENFKLELMPEDDRIDGFENLQVLDIENCQLSGKIPLWISWLTNLEMLLLNSNRLTGPIPGWINSLSHLFYMDVSSNSLTGEIPSTLMEMPMLKSTDNSSHLGPRVFELPLYIDPSHRYLADTSFPVVLNLSNNNFTGVIPSLIGQLKMLGVLDFSFNKLSGQIPQSICNLTKLRVLDLSRNKLIGAIPESTCNLTSLEVLDLSNNNLTGAIPAALNSLHFLAAFNISDNDLEGPIPSGGQFNTFVNSSFNGNTKLCGSMLIHKCGSEEAPPAAILSTKQTDYKVVFTIAFSAFFDVGVLYDQIVLSRYFG